MRQRLHDSALKQKPAKVSRSVNTFTCFTIEVFRHCYTKIFQLQTYLTGLDYLYTFWVGSDFNHSPVLRDWDHHRCRRQLLELVELDTVREAKNSSYDDLCHIDTAVGLAELKCESVVQITLKNITILLKLVYKQEHIRIKGPICCWCKDMLLYGLDNLSWVFKVFSVHYERRKLQSTSATEPSSNFVMENIRLIKDINCWW